MAELETELERARAAAADGDWAAAYATLREADPATLDARDLELFADAAWWICETEESLAHRQKAYAAFAAAADDEAAAGVAARLTMEFFLRGQPSVGAGWLGRAQRHARELPDSPNQGYLLAIESTVKRFMGDLDASLDLAQRAVEAGRRSSDRNLFAMAIHSEGLALIALGRIREGVALLDEAMTSVIAGELTPFFTGILYCNVIAMCLDLGDLRRASEWADASTVWCETLPPDSPYPGLCRVNRAVVARMSGSLDEAEAEAGLAAEQLARFAPEDARYAFYQVGEIRRERGDLPGAEEAFERARELGSDALPGLALLRLAEGKLKAAAAAMQLTDDSKLPPERARILAAAVEIAIANDDLETARDRTAELDDLAKGFPALPFEALALASQGAVLLADGDARGSLVPLRRACGLWQELKLPYETAQARVLCGRALIAAGESEAAEQEFRAARAVFERLGASADVAAVSRELAEPASLPAGLTAREAEVLRLVAAGKTNRDIAVELVLSVHTVGRHLQNIFAKLGVSTRAAATAYAFEHDLA